MELQNQQRDHLMDNLKALMLLLVIVGHTLDPYIVEENSFYRYLMQYIYLFHMPMFAFVTGYFSKNVDKARETAVRNVLFPYLFWQILYILMAVVCISVGLASFNTDVFEPSILLPTSPLYYLICVFFWKVFIKDISRLRWPLLFSIVAGLLVSIVKNEGFHIGIGATFSLMIFFVLGFLCTKETIQKIRKMPKWVGVGILLLAIVPAVFLPYEFRNVRFTYPSVGLSNWVGMAYRLLFYAIAALMIVALINVMSSKKRWFSHVGTNAIIVYAGSTFAAPSLYLLIGKFIPALNGQTWINLLGIFVFAFAIVLFCAMPWIKRVYDWIMARILRICFRE